jgi:ribose transport system ATP-binding protein
MLGVMGYNGAGKSTLVRVIGGLIAPDGGRITIGEGSPGLLSLSPAMALEAGIRVVFQELSVYPTLTVAENVVVRYVGLRGRRWRKRAGALVMDHLDTVFPGHRIAVHTRVSELSLSERQMVEIVLATLDAPPRARILICDEPTSSLSQEWANSFFRYLVAHVREERMACLLVSHRLGDIRDHTDRVAVMANGRIVAVENSAGLTTGMAATLMAGKVTQTAGSVSAQQAPQAVPLQRHPAGAAVVARGLRTSHGRRMSLTIRRGEVVGIGGLAGEGQEEVLKSLWQQWRIPAALRRHADFGCRVAYIAGDRGREGVFPIWSVGRNLSVSTLSSMRKWGVLVPAREEGLYEESRTAFGIVGQYGDTILSLSGGNQQKVLIARALASQAQLLLLNDPLRGVDISTKQDFYRLIRVQAESGTSFLWFSTETEGLRQCDRVIVMHGGEILEELRPDEVTDTRLVKGSLLED